jgi:Na+/H+-dicarboxylate symporter/ABC-type amino acid transport substrate-binding protein
MAEEVNGSVPEAAPTAGPEAAPRRRWRPSLTTLILAGLVLGVLAGLFFGEPMGKLRIVGTIFIRLTLITVIPYILIALVHGIGSLDATTAKRLATRGLPVLAVFWALTIGVLYVMPIAFPKRTIASFFDPNRFPGAGTKATFDWASYIPANPFESLSNGLVPAIVIFSLCVGIALIGVSRKQGFLNGLAFMDDVLARINHAIIMYASPVGVFAVVASAVGTMEVDVFKGVAVFLATYAFATLVLSLCVLPLVAIVVAGVSYRQLVSAFKAPALLALTTANALITVPLIVKGVKELLKSRGASEREVDDLSATLVPVAFAIPLVGTLGTLLFVLFVAWFDGTKLGVAQYASLTVSGLFSLFGEPRLAIQFLLDQMSLPSEGVSLYLASEQLMRNLMEFIGVLSMGLFAATAGAAVLGRTRVRLRPALVAAAVAVLLVAAGTAGLTVLLRPFGTSAGAGYETLQRMRAEAPVPVHVYKTIAESPDPPPAPAGADLLTTVQRRGVLRVGYAPEALPFSFFNGEGELAGYDIQRTYTLAAMVDARRIDFIPVNRQDFASELDTGFVDIVVGGVDLTPTLYKEVDFSSVYMTLHIAVVAPDAQADDYRTEARLAGLRGRRLAVEKGSYYATALRAGNPNLTIVELDDSMDFFKGDVADALFTSAEEGSAYTLMYPHYDVVVPEFEQPPLFLAYPVPKHELEWLAFVDNWLVVEESSGAGQKEYDYWITGKTAVEKQPRWSIIRNVLGWVK